MFHPSKTLTKLLYCREQLVRPLDPEYLLLPHNTAILLYLYKILQCLEAALQLGHKMTV